jgi:aspartyl-tRNA synthetase
MKRTHHCNELRASDAGRAVILTGWVHSRRDLGGVLFIDLRDREGRTQTVFDPSDLPPAVFDVASKLHAESVIEIEGKVRVRPEGTRNIKIALRRLRKFARQGAAAAVDAMHRSYLNPESNCRCRA